MVLLLSESAMAFTGFKCLSMRLEGSGMDLKHRHSHLLMDYWQGLRTAANLPHQGELDADILRCLLPNIILVDQNDNGQVNVRLAGRDARVRFGVTEQSWSFLGSFAASDQARVAAELAHAVEKGHPLRLFLLALMKSGGWTEFEAVLLPVQSEDATASHFIGVHLPLGVSEANDTILEQYVFEISPMALDLMPPAARASRGCGGAKRGLRLVSSRD
jgi:hypothetical protein